MGNLTNSFATTPVSEYDATKVATYNAALQILDSAIAGRLAISTTGGTTTLTGTAAAPQAQNLFLDVSGTLTSNATIEIPVAAGTGRNRLYVVKNGTSGAYTLTVKKVGGTGVTVTQGYTAALLYNDTDIVRLFESSSGGASGNFGAWSSWTPTWTNVTVNNGTVTAKYVQIGKLVVCHLELVSGSSTSISGAITFSLPVTRASYGGTLGIAPLGICRAYDVTPGDVFVGILNSLTTTTVQPRFLDSSGTYLKDVASSATIPFTWATTDELLCQFSYEAA